VLNARFVIRLRAFGRRVAADALANLTFDAGIRVEAAKLGYVRPS
jgi:hypothetical protein